MEEGDTDSSCTDRRNTDSESREDDSHDSDMELDDGSDDDDSGNNNTNNNDDDDDDDEDDDDGATVGPYSRAFYKKSRKGSIIKITNDRYLRDDMECGFMHGGKLLSKALQDLMSEAPHHHLLLVDTNVVLHEIDVLEYNCPGTSFVVITQTVLQEVKHRNLPVFRRVLNLLNDKKRSYIFFPNEVSVSTNSPRRTNETMNDFNDRLIRRSVSYFQSIFDEIEVGKALLLTNDVANRTLALSEGIEAFSMVAYSSKYLLDYPELQDILAIDSTSYVAKSAGKSIYPLHMPIDELLEGVKQGKYIKGAIRVKRNDYNECYVMSRDPSQPDKRISIEVKGAARVNRAIDGDIVIIELISGDTAVGEDTLTNSELDERVKRDEKESGTIRDFAEASFEQIEGVSLQRSDSKCSSSSSGGGGQNKQDKQAGLQGRVVGIAKRNWRQYAGSIDKSGKHDEASDDLISTVFYPVNRKIPPIRILTHRIESLLGNRILVSLDNWFDHCLYPYGHYVKTMGIDGDKETENAILLHEFDVPCNSFSKEVMACLPPEDWEITEDIVKQRRDLRSVPIVSIDPPGCKDIDDALHCIELPNGNLEAGVHIADVTYFLHPDTAIDKEAAHRSTSTYLVDRRLDMLPGYLTTQLCSLRSSEEHLAFSVVWEMTKDGEIISVDFFKSVIHSVASLTYAQAQDMLDDVDKKSDPQVIKSVKLLNHLAKIFRNKRIEMGALTLASPEVRFVFKSDNEEENSSNPTDVTLYELRESNALVEEWMLLANITVGKKILRHYPTLSILRRHQPPSREQFSPLVAAAKVVGIDIDISSSKALADSLDLAIKPDDPYFNKLIRMMSTRCMMPAQYFCSGEIPKEEWHHYGLAAPVYTHFTSPIRRYADVLVHRLLAAAIGVISLPAGNTDKSMQQEICTHMNRRHKAAQYVQRASVNLYTQLFFKGRKEHQFAYVLSLSDEKLTMLVPKYGMEGEINLVSLSEDIKAEVELVSSECKVVLHSKDPSINRDLSLQVFQKVWTFIQIHEDDTGDRKIVFTLDLQGTFNLPPPSTQVGDRGVAHNDGRSASATGTSSNSNNTVDRKKKATGSDSSVQIGSATKKSKK